MLEPTTGEDAQALATANATRHDWIAEAGRQDRASVSRRYLRTGDLAVSTTDPEAIHLRQRDGVRLGYQAHYLVDGGAARIILAALVTLAEVPEDWPAADLAWRARFRWRLWPRQATGDTAYGTLGLIRTLEDQHVRAYIPLPDFDSRSPYFGRLAFTYDPARDAYTCPQGHTLRYRSVSRGPRIYLYKGDAATCNACPLKARCTPSPQGRVLSRSYDEAYFDRVRAYQATAPYRKAIRKRSVCVEPLFGEAKQWQVAWAAPLPVTPPVAREQRNAADGEWTEPQTATQPRRLGASPLPRRDAWPPHRPRRPLHPPLRRSPRPSPLTGHVPHPRP